MNTVLYCFMCTRLLSGSWIDKSFDRSIKV